ncbi:hypothetical protein DITRI_Ditri11bG0073400 [Diplodiscus trichospermus]
MDIPQEFDEYTKEAIRDSLGLQISSQSLQLKLYSFEEAQCCLLDNCLFLFSNWRRKIKQPSDQRRSTEKIHGGESEACSRACANLLTQCNKWERYC